MKDEDYEKALDEFRKAVSINSRLSEALINLAWTISEMVDHGGDSSLLKEANSSARRAIQLEKDTSKLWHHRAVYSKILYQQNRFQQGLDEARQAVKLSPTAAQAYYYLALIQVKLGRINDARKSLVRIYESDESVWRKKAEALSFELK